MSITNTSTEVKAVVSFGSIDVERCTRTLLGTENSINLHLHQVKCVCNI